MDTLLRKSGVASLGVGLLAPLIVVGEHYLGHGKPFAFVLADVLLAIWLALNLKLTIDLVHTPGAVTATHPAIFWAPFVTAGFILLYHTLVYSERAGTGTFLVWVLLSTALNGFLLLDTIGWFNGKNDAQVRKQSLVILWVPQIVIAAAAVISLFVGL